MSVYNINKQKELNSLEGTMINVYVELDPLSHNARTKILLTTGPTDQKVRVKSLTHEYDQTGLNSPLGIPQDEKKVIQE